MGIYGAQCGVEGRLNRAMPASTRQRSDGAPPHYASGVRKVQNLTGRTHNFYFAAFQYTSPRLKLQQTSSCEQARWIASLNFYVFEPVMARVGNKCSLVGQHCSQRRVAREALVTARTDDAVVGLIFQMGKGGVKFVGETLSPSWKKKWDSTSTLHALHEK